MRRFLAVVVVLAVALAGGCSAEKSPPSGSYRWVDSPARNWMFSYVSTQKICSPADLEPLLDLFAAYEEGILLVSVLEDVKFDPATECMVILSHSETSGANEVIRQKPYVNPKGELVCKFSRRTPDGGATAEAGEEGIPDMAYYGYVMIVKRDAFTNVVLRVEGKPDVRVRLG